MFCVYLSKMGGGGSTSFLSHYIAVTYALFNEQALLVFKKKKVSFTNKIPKEETLNREVFFHKCYDLGITSHIESIGFLVIDFKIHHKCK